MSKNTFLAAGWRKLVMFNYSVDPAVLLPYLPAHTVLDTWNGTCYISLVGFMFLNTKMKGIKIPFHVNFEEVNLRFYVKYNDPETGDKRGVVFIKELVPKPAIAWVANTVYRENYEALPMRHEWKTDQDSQEISYGMKKQGKWMQFRVKAATQSSSIGPGTEPEFITEHYWGYAAWDKTTTNEYEVTHPRWEIYPVQSYQLDLDFEVLYGSSFGFLNRAKPVSVFLAEGSEIKVMKGKIIR